MQSNIMQKKRLTEQKIKNLLSRVRKGNPVGKENGRRRWGATRAKAAWYWFPWGNSIGLNRWRGERTKLGRKTGTINNLEHKHCPVAARKKKMKKKGCRTCFGGGEQNKKKNIRRKYGICRENNQKEERWAKPQSTVGTSNHDFPHSCKKKKLEKKESIRLVLWPLRRLKRTARG